MRRKEPLCNTLNVKTISDWVEGECIEPNEKFDCPSCGVTLRYAIDEGTYYGTQHMIVEVVDE
ncbi:hypothetical protein [Aliivibrio fischeri]|uniref:hypothetical protein n=1 Tax=Aliivibrio fischeri TaxID=668 RepID=UPI001585004D|nr:hypothetical protein [Aliivibrio fischeri]